jgi:hypothetical protein
MAGDALLEQRYGRRPSPAPRRRLWVIAVAFVVIGVVWAGWIGLQQARTPVRWQEVRFTPVDAGHSELIFTVTADPGHRAICTVRIFNSGLTEVGGIDVPVGPSTLPSFSVTATVPTFELGSSGAVRSCAAR